MCPQHSNPWNQQRAAPTRVIPTLTFQAQWMRVGNGLLFSAFSAFSAAATTNSIQIFSLPAAAIIHGIKIQHTAAFSGGSISAYTIAVGDSVTPTLYASAFNVHQAPGASVYQLSSDFGGESMVAATSIYATATSTGANLSAATAGAVSIWALLSVAS